MPIDQIRQQFLERFGVEPTLIGVAPGRVNLIGEHTDYNDGFVFPAAIDRGLWIAAAPGDGETEVHSVQLGTGSSFDVMEIGPGQIKDWAQYPAGMGWAIRNEGHRLSPIRCLVDSNIPIGSGVSSSAAIEMAFGVIWNEIDGLGLSNRELARLGQVCENKFVGVNSGIMDQMASAMGKEGRAMFLDTRSLEIAYAPVPSGVSVVLLDTKKPRELTDSAYNERRSQCEEACRLLGVPTLRDATLEDLEAARPTLPEVVYRRARHVITENARCVEFREALQNDELERVGKLMRASHESLRDDYEVSCAELDAMAVAAWEAPGVIGARMTGAGFGGACVALVHTEELAAFEAHTLDRYRVATNRIGEAMSCQIVEGARLIAV